MTTQDRQLIDPSATNIFLNNILANVITPGFKRKGVLNKKGGCSCMEIFMSFVVAVMAGVTCHYVIKWLDGNKDR